MDEVPKHVERDPSVVVADRRRAPTRALPFRCHARSTAPALRFPFTTKPAVGSGFP
jgi:hypothetical protein